MPHKSITTNNRAEHNQRFIKNHMKIYVGILKIMRRFRINITYAQIAKETGITLKTVKKHCGDVNEFIGIIESLLINEYRMSLRKVSLSKADLQSAGKKNMKYITATLLFMSKRQTIFRLICENENNHQILKKMIELLYEKLTITWFPKNEHVPPVDSDTGQMFIAMAIQLVTIWGKETGCSFRNSEECMRGLLTLTEQMKIRCHI